MGRRALPKASGHQRATKPAHGTHCLAPPARLTPPHSAAHHLTLPAHPTRAAHLLVLLEPLGQQALQHRGGHGPLQCCLQQQRLAQQVLRLGGGMGWKGGGGEGTSTCVCVGGRRGSAYHTSARLAPAQHNTAATTPHRTTPPRTLTTRCPSAQPGLTRFLFSVICGVSACTAACTLASLCHTVARSSGNPPSRVAARLPCRRSSSSTKEAHSRRASSTSCSRQRAGQRELARNGGKGWKGCGTCALCVLGSRPWQAVRHCVQHPRQADRCE